MVDAHEGSGVLAQLLIKGAFGDALGRTGPTRDRVAEQHAHCLVELGNASVKMSADSRFHRAWACLYRSFESYRKRAVADSKKKAPEGAFFKRLLSDQNTCWIPTPIVVTSVP